MATLNNSDFISGGKLKTASQGTFPGKTRLEIVHIMIKKNIPFIIGTNESGTKVYGVKFEGKDGKKPTVSNWKYSLTYSKSKSKSQPHITESITRFYKGPNFGGGGRGSGGGAKETALTESGQAYYMSLIFNVVKRPLTLKDATDKNFTKAAKFVDATVSYKDFAKDGPADWVDEGVYIKTANKVYERYGKKFGGEIVYCHRGSQFMKNLYKAKAVAHTLDKKKDNLAPGSFSNDKWNPGDIWLTTELGRAEPLKECGTFKDLQKCVLDFAGEGQFFKTTLLGVSLKKTGTTAQMTFYNMWTDPKNRKHNKDGDIKYNGFTFGKTGDFFSSNDIYLYFGTQLMQFRGSSTSKGSWQGLLIGETAYGGKCGGGNVNYYLEQNGKKSISYNGGLQEEGWSEPKLKPKEFYDLYKKFINKQKNIPKQKAEDVLKTQKAFEAKIEEQKTVNKKFNKDAFMMWKGVGLALINQLDKISAQSANKFATEVVRYAASNTDLSSFFVKVH